MQNKKIKSPLNGRGNAMLIACPALFGVTEALFHAHPIVGGAVGILAGAIAYRHYDDMAERVETLKGGIIDGYVEHQKHITEVSTSQYREKKVDVQSVPPKIDIRDIPIPIGTERNGKRFERTLRQLKSILILGLQEGGKTNTAIHVLRHTVKHGARLAIIDKHARSEEDSMTSKIQALESRFDCPIGYNPETALQVVNHVKAVLDERLEGGKCSYPLFIVVDEFTAIMRQATLNKGKWKVVADGLEELIGDINQEGRKHQVFAICIGQIANASSTGGTELRELFATRIVHAMSAKQANLLSLTEINKQVERLGKGEVFFQTEGFNAFWLKIPYVESHEIKQLAASLPPIEKGPDRSEIDRIAFSGLEMVSNFDSRNDRDDGFRAEMMSSGNTLETDEMKTDFEESFETDFTQTTRELIAMVATKNDDAQLIVREQLFRFEEGSEQRSLSQIAKDYGFSSGTNWQKCVELLRKLQSYVG